MKMAYDQGSYIMVGFMPVSILTAFAHDIQKQTDSHQAPSPQAHSI
jgi:hypothetical protein